MYRVANLLLGDIIKVCLKIYSPTTVVAKEKSTKSREKQNNSNIHTIRNQTSSCHKFHTSERKVKLIYVNKTIL